MVPVTINMDLFIEQRGTESWNIDMIDCFMINILYTSWYMFSSRLVQSLCEVTIQYSFNVSYYKNCMRKLSKKYVIKFLKCAISERTG